MKNGSAIAFPEIDVPAGSPSQRSGFWPALAAGFSVLLHAALATLALAVSLGGWLGGSGLGGTACEAGAGGGVRIAGIVRLSAGDGVAQPLDDRAALPSPAMPEAHSASGALTSADLPTLPETTQAEDAPQALPDAAKSLPILKKTPQKQREAQDSRAVAPQRAPESARAAAAAGDRAATRENTARSVGQTGRREEGAAKTGRDGDALGGERQAGDGSAEGQGPADQGAGLFAKVDKMPRVISRSRVRYPETARKQGLVGHVLLRFHLDEKGGMSQLHVVQAEPPGVFEKAALAAVREWRFAPAEKNGVPVAYWVELPMPFVLR
jgi:TonB family protein